MHTSLLSSAGRRAALVSLGAFAALALALSPIGAPPALAAVGHGYKYFGSYGSGTSIRVEGAASSYQTRYYSLTGQSGATSKSGYSVDFHGTPPANNNNYTEAAWSELSQPEAVAARGPVEWILKQSYPSASTTVLRDRLRAIPEFSSFPTGYFGEADAIAATQAAIWHFTDGVDLDLAVTSNARIRLLYQYLLQGAAGQAPSTGTAPSIDLQAEGDRTSFAIEPGGSLGPITLTGDAPAVLSVDGPARIVGDDGAALTGALQPGTRFWVQPTDVPAAAGAATVRSQTQPASVTVVNAALGQQHVAPRAARENLAVLDTVTLPAATAQLRLDWSIDLNSPDAFDPDGGETTRTYTYYPVYSETSATLERVAFTDGTSTETDLIGLNGGTSQGADVYSADFVCTVTKAGQRGPDVPANARFAEGDWSASRSVEVQGNVARILQQSYPELTVSQFTAALKSAGVLAVSAGNIKNWEAIAAAQAAIWHFTDGKELDVTRYADPSAVAGAAAEGTSAEQVLDGDPATFWRAEAAGEAILDFAFPADFEPRSYSVTSADGRPVEQTPTSWRLQRSLDGGATYSDVSTSGVTHVFSEGGETRVSGNIPPGASYGAYSTQYRIVFSGAQDAAQPVEVGDIRFEGFGVFGAQPSYVYKQYANSTNVVLAYQYLVADALANPVAAPQPSIQVTAAATDFTRESGDQLIGPFVLTGSSSAELSLAGAAEARLLTSPTGERSTTLVAAPGTEFWIDPSASDAGEITVRALGTAYDWVTSRALDNAAGGCATLTQLGVESIRADSQLTVRHSFAEAETGGGDDGTTPIVERSAPKPGGELARAGQDEQGLRTAVLAAVLLLGGGAALLLGRRAVFALADRSRRRGRE